MNTTAARQGVSIHLNSVGTSKRSDEKSPCVDTWGWGDRFSWLFLRGGDWASAVTGSLIHPSSERRWFNAETASETLARHKTNAGSAMHLHGQSYWWLSLEPHSAPASRILTGWIAYKDMIFSVPQNHMRRSGSDKSKNNNSAQGLRAQFFTICHFANKSSSIMSDLEVTSV